MRSLLLSWAVQVSTQNSCIDDLSVPRSLLDISKNKLNDATLIND